MGGLVALVHEYLDVPLAFRSDAWYEYSVIKPSPKSSLLVLAVGCLAF